MPKPEEARSQRYLWLPRCIRGTPSSSWFCLGLVLHAHHESTHKAAFIGNQQCGSRPSLTHLWVWYSGYGSGESSSQSTGSRQCCSTAFPFLSTMLTPKIVNNDTRVVSKCVPRLARHYPQMYSTNPFMLKMARFYWWNEYLGLGSGSRWRAFTGEMSV